MGDHRPRVLSEKCNTCVLRPGNLMHLAEGRLAGLIEQNVARGTALICHKTLPYGEHPDYGEAMCRGFYDAVGERTNIIRVINRLGGFAEVPPPSEGPDQ